ncbi:hypothetical protein CLOP_g5539 [Closterium sp. NIES-67]|nr:hypothetical protein CLOP_g5539 [Closterium sp. NIES-67]
MGASIRPAHSLLLGILFCFAVSVAFADDTQVETAFILCDEFGDHVAAAAAAHNISVCAFVLQGEPVDFDLTPAATTSAPAIAGDESSLRRHLLGGGATPVAIQLAQGLVGKTGEVRTQVTAGTWETVGTILVSVLTESQLISRSLVWAIKDMYDTWRTRPQSVQNLQDAIRNVNRAHSNQQTLLSVLNKNPQTKKSKQLSSIRDTVASMTPTFTQLLSLLATWRQQNLHAVTRLHFTAESAGLAVAQAEPAGPAGGPSEPRLAATLNHKSKKDKNNNDNNDSNNNNNNNDKKSKKGSSGGSSSNSGGKGKKKGQKAKVGATQAINVVVAADGSGDYKSIQDAVDAAGPGSTIRIRAGVYNEQVQVSTDRITMIGAGMDQTVITNDASQKTGYDIITSATVGVNADNFVAMSMTIRNTAGIDGQQAVALRVDSDQAAFYQLRISAFQDTLFASTGRQYYTRCFIDGAVDFVFGDAAVVIRNSQLKVQMSPYDTTITASGRLSKSSNTGIVVMDSRVVSFAPRVFLGRPWKDYATSVFINVWLTNKVVADGWMTWAGQTYGGKPFLAEVNSKGPGAQPSRVKWAKPGIASSSDVSQYNPNAFIQLNSWIGSTKIPVS